MILSCILIALAVLCNVVMDKTKDTIQYESSVFYKWGWNPKFWNDEAYDKEFVPFTKYKLNAWHLSKSAMLWLLFVIPFVYKPFLGYLDYPIMLIEWVVLFSPMYHKIFNYNVKD
jgi:hypothetical protein